jgi:MoaD family protein
VRWTKIPELSVKLYSPLREIVGQNEAVVRGSTIAQVLDRLVSKYGKGFQSLLFNGTGSIKPSFIILVNGRIMDLPGGLGTVLKEGDKLAIFPAIAGG